MAAAAGLWEFGVNLEAAEGDALLLAGNGVGLSAYSVEAGGAAALALPPAFLPESVAIIELEIGGPVSTLVLKNFSDSNVSLEGWYLCNVPSYWGLPADLELASGDEVRIDFQPGERAQINAGGALGELTDGAGELALYRDNNFSSSASIVSYVGWNGGKARKSVAQGAGIWGANDVTAAAADILVFTGAGEGAGGWSIQ